MYSYIRSPALFAVRLKDAKVESYLFLIA